MSRREEITASLLLGLLSLLISIKNTYPKWINIFGIQIYVSFFVDSLMVFWIIYVLLILLSYYPDILGDRISNVSRKYSRYIIWFSIISSIALLLVFITFSKIVMGVNLIISIIFIPSIYLMIKKLWSNYKKYGKLFIKNKKGFKVNFGIIIIIIFIINYLVMYDIDVSDQTMFNLTLLFNMFLTILVIYYYDNKYNILNV